MELKTLKDFAAEQNVSYEAIRRQVKNYSGDLEGHVIIKNRTQFLDEYAVNFLKQKRRENPVIVMHTEANEQVEELKAQVDLLKSKLLAAQEQILALKNEEQKALEAKIRSEILLEDNKAKEEALRAAAVREAEIQRLCDQAQAEVRSYHKTFFGLYKKTSVDITEK
ncbi:MAG: hypothetical protein K6E51_14675 [Treponema sp.]|nr:hypothetical protein [Treponema sp.]